MADFVAAYNRSRFWHGDRSGNITVIAQTGLLVSQSNSYPTSVNPTNGNGGGIICLGTTYTASGEYGQKSVARVFLGADRAGTFAGNGSDGYRMGTFRQGDDQIWRDGGAAKAVSTWADIPGNCIWVGTLKELCAWPDTDNKCVAIFANIASFDSGLPTSVSALKAMMLQAIDSGLLKDEVDEAMENPILPKTKGPTPVNVTNGTKKQKRGCAIM